MKAYVLLVSALLGSDTATAFVAPQIRQTALVSSHQLPSSVLCRQQLVLSSTRDENQHEDDAEVNPYADPNFPELEFVNYDDPDYQAFGDDDEFFPTTSSGSSEEIEAEIEAMREDRRRRNDEYQFQTYFAEILKNGQEYKGEWTVYQTSTFLDDVPDHDNGIPRLVKAARPIKVVSRGYKINVETDSPYPVDAERICHEEVAVTQASNNPLSDELYAFEKQLLARTYWPEQLSAFDFRGEQGIMCVGNAYTICTAKPLSDQQEANQGPFAEYRAEIGVESEEKRFRVKFDYSVVEKDKSVSVPPLHLKSMTVCRETQNEWPVGPDSDDKSQSVADEETFDALFGPAGADGGLFDPPPIANEEQAGNYMLLDLEGRATVLFPYCMDQQDGAYDGQGWVKTLDWTPGQVRYQVDRKVTGGSKLLGLRTLELSSIRPEDVDEYRPRDGGEDMRQ